MEPKYVSRNGQETVRAWRFVEPVVFPVPAWINSLVWKQDENGTHLHRGTKSTRINSGEWVVDRNGVEIWPMHAFSNAFIPESEAPVVEKWPTERKVSA